jgi:hypothetical protein
MDSGEIYDLDWTQGVLRSEGDAIRQLERMRQQHREEALNEYMDRAGMDGGYWLDARNLVADEQGVDLSGNAGAGRYVPPDTVYSGYTTPGGSQYREILFKLPTGFAGSAGTYRATHFGQNATNLFAHARITTRKTEDGKSVLLIDEIQSDWHQAARDKGYEDKERERARIEARDALEKLEEAERVRVGNIREAVRPVRAQAAADYISLVQNIGQEIWYEGYAGQRVKAESLETTLPEGYRNHALMALDRSSLPKRLMDEAIGIVEKAIRVHRTEIKVTDIDGDEYHLFLNGPGTKDDGLLVLGEWADAQDLDPQQRLGMLDAFLYISQRFTSRTLDEAAEHFGDYIFEMLTNGAYMVPEYSAIAEERARLRGLAEGSSGIMDVPWKNNAWVNLVLKRMIRWAVDNGFEEVAWTPGNYKNGERHPDLKADRVVARETRGGNVRFSAYKNGQQVKFYEVGTHGGGRSLSNIIGGAAAEQLMAAPLRNDERVLEGDFTIHQVMGWEFYDKIIPNMVKKLTKKYNAAPRPQTIVLSEGKSDLMLSIPVTEELKEAARTGQFSALFQGGDPNGWGSVSPPEGMRPMRLNLAHTRQAYGDEAVDNLPKEILRRSTSGTPIDSMMELLKAVKATLNAKTGVDVNSPEYKAAKQWEETLSPYGLNVRTDGQDKMRRKLRDYLSDQADDSVTADEAAKQFGFSDGKALLDALAAIGERQKHIKKAVDKEMQETFGDPFHSDGFEQKVREEAEESVRSSMGEIELEALARAVGEQASSRLAKQMAEDALAKMSIREIMKWRRFQQAERREMNAAPGRGPQGQCPAGLHP